MTDLTYKVFIALLILFTNSLDAQNSKQFNSTDLSIKSVRSTVTLSPEESIDSISPYKLNRIQETVLLGSGGILGISGMLLVNNVQPLTLEEINQLDPADINKFDRHAVGTLRNYLAGDLLLYGSILLPLSFLSKTEIKRDWKILGIMGIETLMFQAGLNVVIKGLTQRIRPYVYDPNPSQEKKTGKEAKLSFYSGHTSTTAAMSFFTAKVFSDYLPDGLTKYLIWTGAIIYPALAGYLRVDSANHFPTDVLVGYAVGALIGYYIPELHKRDGKDGLSVYPSFMHDHFSFIALYSF
jgi:membrane-associated phospholipid phosphatase